MSDIRLTPVASQIITDNGQNVEERMIAIEGVSIPNGGTTGQVLAKASAADQDLVWNTVSGSGPIAEIESPDTTNSVLASDANGVEVKINGSNVLQVNDSSQIIIGGGAAEASTRTTIRNTQTFQLKNFSVAALNGNYERHYRPGVSLTAPEKTPTNAIVRRQDYYLYDSTANDYVSMGYEQWKGGQSLGSNPGIIWELVTTDTGGSGGARLAVNQSGNVGVGFVASSIGSEKLEVNGGIKLGNSTNTNLGALRWDGTNFQGYTASGWTTFSAADSVTLKTTTTQIRNVNSYAAITELTTDSLTTGTYHFTFIGKANTSATTSGMGFRIGAGTATITPVVSQFFVPQAASGTASNYQLIQLDGTTNVTSASAVTNGVDYPIIGFGYFTVTVAGTVAMQMRPEVNGNGVQIAVGAAFTYRKI